MTFADWRPIISDVLLALIAAIGATVVGLIKIYVPLALAAFEKRTHIALTEQQRAAILQAAQTQAGIIETQLQQGVLKLSDVRENGPEMLERAKLALAHVPEAAEAVDIGPFVMSGIIVGKADTAKALAAPPAAPAQQQRAVMQPIPTVGATRP